MLKKNVRSLLKELKRLKHEVMKGDTLFTRSEISNAKARLKSVVLQLKSYKEDSIVYGRYRSKLIKALNKFYGKAKWRGDRQLPNWDLYLTKELLEHYKNIKTNGIDYIV